MNIQEKIKLLCESEAEKESCGIIIFENKRTKIVPCSNVSKNPANFFEIQISEQIEAMRRGKILAIYHSHLNQCHNFSKEDLKYSEEMIVPFLVYSLKNKKHNIYVPEKSKKDREIKNFLKRISRFYSVN